MLPLLAWNVRSQTLMHYKILRTQNSASVHVLHVTLSFSLIVTHWSVIIIGSSWMEINVHCALPAVGPTQTLLLPSICSSISFTNHKAIFICDERKEKKNRIFARFLWKMARNKLHNEIKGPNSTAFCLSVVLMLSVDLMLYIDCI